jgi:hypothetical protein
VVLQLLKNKINDFYLAGWKSSFETTIKKNTDKQFAI